ncbi:MAG: HAD-IIA family hydrolase [Anaerolineae bacterium]|nr:HAD-IIA family hydrolase [Anaerolineae bacterium]
MHRLEPIRHLIIDMDGVLYLGNTPMPGLQDFFAFLHERQIDFQLVTNNATLTPGMYVQKMAGMGVQVDESDVLTSATGTAEYLASRFPQGSRVYAICEEGMQDALQNKGLVLSRRDPVAVVVSMDRDLTYAKLREATLLIRSGVPFIASNPDRTLPVPEGQIPGTGTIVAAVEIASDCTPIIIGKPEPFLMIQAMKRMGATTETTAAVGDRPETDILSAQRAGILSILALSGATDRDRLSTFDIKPDLIFDDIRALMAAWARVLA